MDLWAPLPDWRWESLMMRGVGTISWFLLPCSTCFELHRLGLWIFFDRLLLGGGGEWNLRP